MKVTLTLLAILVIFPLRAHSSDKSFEITIGKDSEADVSVALVRLRKFFTLKEFDSRFVEKLSVSPQLVFGRTNPSGNVLGFEVMLRAQSRRLFSLEGGVGANGISAHDKIKKLGGMLQFSSQVRLGASIHISENYILEPGVGLVHYSNAGLERPNNGLNVPFVFVGLRF